tara:strand:- start:95 stop:619 length:525 start_codon:yes stop_codon:yes gene_type:complete
LIGKLKILDKTTAIAQIVPLREASYNQFKEFLNSLDEERKTWSLDLQHYKNDKEFYDNMIYAIVCVYDKKILGLLSTYERPNNENIPMIEVSFVVKKEYQKQGIGLALLKEAEDDAKKNTVYECIIAKHFKDNIASHKAFIKAGYKELKNEYMEIIESSHGHKYDFSWKIKKIA